jgi:trehalose 6-phosphate synthase/phosphatase
MSSVRRILGEENIFSQITIGNRIVKADTFPMGIDYKRFANSSSDHLVQRNLEQINRKLQNRKIILSVDRLDYSKGITNRLEAFNLFLENNPEYREEVTLILIVAPSRTKVERYMSLKTEIDRLVGKINGKHNTIGWIPVWYLYRYFTFDRLAAFYKIADVALITPMRDGMNLIAKEYIASRTNGRGVLILSEMAGAANELGECISINPCDIKEMAAAIKIALEMPEEEQSQRIRAMQRRLKRYSVVRWADDFIDTMNQVRIDQDEYKLQKLTEMAKKELIKEYQKGKRCLFLLDYDGTLVPFAKDPLQATPDKELHTILRDLTRNDKNEIVITSGRKLETMNQWFRDLNINLVAEHGLWVKEKDNEPEILESLTSEWKEEIRPILELYVDRTPGAFIEEKDHSLVWHYRKSDPELGSLRTRELKEAIMGLIANTDLSIMKGSKVLEIKNNRVNKGLSTLRYLKKDKWDFIIGIGDDWTDEDIFEVLPDKAFSIKVGVKSSRAKHYVDSPREVRNLLKELSQN